MSNATITALPTTHPQTTHLQTTHLPSEQNPATDPRGEDEFGGNDATVIDLRDNPFGEAPTRAMSQPLADGARRPSPGARRSGRTSRPRLGTAGRAGAIELRTQNKTRRYERLEAVFAWAEQHGHRVHTDALLMIVECEADFATWPPDCWTEHGLWQFLWSEVNTACVLAGRTEPKGMAETMWLYLEYLNQTIGLAAGSDPLARLQAFLQEYGDLTDTGSPRNPDDGPGPAQYTFDLEPAA